MLEKYFSHFYFRRYFALMIDMAFAVMIALLVEFLQPIIGITQNTDVPFMVVMFLLFIKDIATKDGSLGKRICGLKLLGNNNNNNNNHIKIISIIRNVFLIIMPLEIIVFLISKGKRIGDLLFKTKVIETR